MCPRGWEQPTRRRYTRELESRLDALWSSGGELSQLPDVVEEAKHAFLECVLDDGGRDPSRSKVRRLGQCSRMSPEW
jgi:hypothetical protein